MAFLHPKKQYSTVDADGVSLQDVESISTSYTPVASNEEYKLKDGHSIQRPTTIPRKPLSGKVDTFETIRVNDSFSLAEPPQMLHHKPVHDIITGVVLGVLTLPFYFFLATSWHVHNDPVLSQEGWHTYSQLGNKV